MSKVAICLLVLAAAGGCEKKRTRLPRGDRSPAHILNNAESRRALSAKRGAILAELERQSEGPIKIRVDAETRAVALLQASLPEYRATAATHTQVAQSFIARHWSLIDPRIKPTELVPRSEKGFDCTPPGSDTDRTPSPATVVFDRLVHGVPVLGGSVIVRFGQGGVFEQLQNTLPSVAAGDARSTVSRPKAIGTAPRTAGSKQGATAPDPRFARLIADLPSRRVLVARQVGEGGKLEPGVIEISVDGASKRSSVRLDAGTVLGPWKIGTGSDNQSPTGTRVHVDQRTGLPDFVSYRSSSGIQVSAPGPLSPSEVAYQYLTDNPAMFRTGAPKCQFRLADVRTSATGGNTTFVRLEQVIANTRVYGAQLVFEIEGNRVVTVQGHTLPKANMRLHARVSPGAATRAAQVRLRAVPRSELPYAVDYTSSPRIELVIFPGAIVKGAPDRSLLAYYVEFSDFAFFVDAQRGWVVYGYPRFASNHIVTDCNGGGRDDLESCVTTSTNAIPETGVAGNADAEAAAVPLARTMSFLGGLGWAGLDGEGSDVVVNTDVALGSCPDQAVFSADLLETLFCLGAGRGDVIAHEVSHGVIHHSSGLANIDESGALNESYADIFANLAIPDAVPVGDDTAPGWLAGEEVTFANFLRDMADPSQNQGGADPGHYDDYIKRDAAGCAYNANVPNAPFVGAGCDFGEIHSNMSIPSLAHVLLSDGIDDPDEPSNSVQGIGRDKVAMLAFDVATRRLTPWSNMPDAALATLASCETFAALGVQTVTSDPSTFTQEDCDSVIAAFRRVGLYPGLDETWVPSDVAFSGGIPRFEGVTRSNCVASLTLEMRVEGDPNDTGDDEVLEKTATSDSPNLLTINYRGIQAATIENPSPPIDSRDVEHWIRWWNIEGGEPDLVSRYQTAACPRDVWYSDDERRTLDNDPELVSAPNGHLMYTGSTRVGARGNLHEDCVLKRMEVQVLNAGGGSAVSDPLVAIWPINLGLPGAPIYAYRMVAIWDKPDERQSRVNWDLRARAAYAWDVGQGEVSWRFLYDFEELAGATCGKPD